MAGRRHFQVHRERHVDVVEQPLSVLGRVHAPHKDAKTRHGQRKHRLLRDHRLTQHKHDRLRVAALRRGQQNDARLHNIYTERQLAFRRHRRSRRLGRLDLGQRQKVDKRKERVKRKDELRRVDRDDRKRVAVRFLRVVEQQLLAIVRDRRHNLAKVRLAAWTRVSRSEAADRKLGLEVLPRRLVHLDAHLVQLELKELRAAQQFWRLGMLVKQVQLHLVDRKLAVKPDRHCHRHRRRLRDRVRGVALGLGRVRIVRGIRR